MVSLSLTFKIDFTEWKKDGVKLQFDKLNHLQQICEATKNTGRAKDGKRHTTQRVHLRKSITDSCNNTHDLNNDYRNDEKKKNPYIQSLLVRQDGERLPASFRKENQTVGLTKDNGSLGRKQWQDSPCFYNPQT